jgi:hypothetical protein
LPAGGCRLTGTWCNGAQECCGGGTNPNGSVQCIGGRCDNGQACNPVGNICGAPVLPDGGKINASQDCCDGMKAVCKTDSSGIPRCFGGGSTQCPTGYTGMSPCCIMAGQACQFRDQCCNGALCVPNQFGVAVCSLPMCTGLGLPCNGSGQCCTGTECVNLVCRVPMDGGTMCTATGGGCTMSSQCCSMICGTDGGCQNPIVCQPTNGACTSPADCCSGLTCVVNPMTMTGTCQMSTCVGVGQTCSSGGTACCPQLECLDSMGLPCGNTGTCACKPNL